MFRDKVILFIQMLIAGVDKYVVHMIPKGPCHIYIYVFYVSDKIATTSMDDINRYYTFSFINISLSPLRIASGTNSR